MNGQPVLIGEEPIPSRWFLASPREVGEFRLEVEAWESVRGSRCRALNGTCRARVTVTPSTR
jgi:hypothetical protein